MGKVLSNVEDEFLQEFPVRCVLFYTLLSLRMPPHSLNIIIITHSVLMSKLAYSYHA